MRVRSTILCIAVLSIVTLASPTHTARTGIQEAGAVPAPRPARNPIPDTFVNLQVLPKDITKPQLVSIMKQFSITFGVRCSYCHTVSDDLTEGKFDSDDKETKRKARDLLKAIYDSRPMTPPKTAQ